MDHKIKLQPLRVPNFVRTVDGDTAIAIQELEIETIEGLCEQFRHDLLEKAAKGEEDSVCSLVLIQEGGG